MSRYRPVLPPELWDLIFSYLPNTVLLSLGIVSRLFNERCIRLYLVRSGCDKRIDELLDNSGVSLSTGAVRALAHCISSHPFPFNNISCEMQFDTSNPLVPLYALMKVMKRCPKLDELFISFPMVDIFSLPHRGAPTHTVRLLAHTIAQMLRSAPGGPTLVVGANAMFSCAAYDVSGWSQYNLRSPIPTRRGDIYSSERINNDEDASGPPYLTFLRFDRDVRRGYLPIFFGPGEEVNSVDVRLLRATGPYKGWQLVTFNAAFITHLYLRAPAPAYEIRSLEIALRHITLPHLERVGISTRGIDPTALRRFFEVHTTIEAIEFTILHSADAENTTPRSSAGTRRAHLLHPPLNHPSLRQLVNYEHSPQSSPRLVPSFYNSPNLSIFELHFPASVLNPAPFLEDLRTIASRTQTNSLELNLTFFGRPATATLSRIRDAVLPPVRWADSREALIIAASLIRVRKLTVKLVSVSAAQRLLPWLAAFPNLEKLEITVRMQVVTDTAERAKIERKLRADKEKFILQLNKWLVGFHVDVRLYYLVARKYYIQYEVNV
ncbi:hypothetical protein MKEN_00993000 [Mycena kentingensis (nom. inval.)]|nr:hypothetical protein MKEN_00993000 [Mycena kentingensis (nom. inval.)]